METTRLLFQGATLRVLCHFESYYDDYDSFYYFIRVGAWLYNVGYASSLLLSAISVTETSLHTVQVLGVFRGPLRSLA